jgi:hypothetical protein
METRTQEKETAAKTNTTAAARVFTSNEPTNISSRTGF